VSTDGPSSLEYNETEAHERTKEKRHSGGTMDSRHATKNPTQHELAQLFQRKRFSPIKPAEMIGDNRQ
jgi:ribosome assembly protein YihI (activator of Der GTPase)